MANRKSTEDLVSMFMNFGKDMNLPSPDLEVLVARHRKNLQALEDAARTAGDGATSIVERQREMMQEALDEISAMAENMKKGGDAQSMMGAQTDFARRSFEMTLRNTSEIAGMAQRSGAESFKVLQTHMQDTLEELRQAMSGQSKK